MEDAFAELTERMFCSMCRFWIEEQSDFVVDDIGGFLDDFCVIVFHTLITITDAVDRKNANEMHDLGNERLLKNITSRNEDFLLWRHAEQNQSIHQSVSVIGRENTCRILWNILFANDFITTKRFL